MFRNSLFAAVALGFLVQFVAAQTKPSTTTTPTSAPARRALVVPNGFKTITVNQRTAVVEPADEGWVRQALEKQNPTTLPTTMPSDVVNQLKAHREEIYKRVVTDLALTDSSAVEKFLADHLDPPLKRLDEVNPPLFYMVTTERRVIELIKSGWSDPRFYYNRMADRIQTTAGQVSAGPSIDDMLVPCLYPADESAEKKTQRLAEVIQDTESKLARLIAEQARAECYAQFVALIIAQAVEPLHFKEDQEWLGMGLARVLACDYTAIATGEARQTLLRAILIDTIGNPMRLTAVDLLHRPKTADMRPVVVPLFAEAYLRKSSIAVYDWINRAGLDAVPKLLTELRKSMPDDGETLLKLMQQVGGADISADVRANTGPATGQGQ